MLVTLGPRGPRVGLKWPQEDMLNRLTPSSLKPCGNGDESFAETGEFTGQSIAEPLASWVGTSGIPVVLINKAYIYIFY